MREGKQTPIQRVSPSNFQGPTKLNDCLCLLLIQPLSISGQEDGTTTHTEAPWQVSVLWWLPGLYLGVPQFYLGVKLLSTQWCNGKHSHKQKK